MKAWKWIALASIAAGGACGADAGQTGGDKQEPLGADNDVFGGKCGGPDGRVCPSGKFCDTAQANRCPGDEIKGTCREIPQACTHIYQPACGCDGKTYGSACEAASASMAVAYEGACAPFCGGFAGIPCPGNGTCVDNATDACDPLEGDVDCASLCRCEVVGLCTEGMHWDGSPEVCDCVSDG
jgi:hypothetical protein